MIEEHIRPDHLILENAKLHAQDLAQILLHKSDFIKIACPACEIKDYYLRFEKSEFNFVACKKCQTIFINPRPSLTLLEGFYAESKSVKHWNDKIFPASEETRRCQIFLPRAIKIVELCQKHHVTSGSLLDVGAGFGTFCEEIVKLNAFDNVIAVEPSKELAATCRAKGISVIENTIENIKVEDINVITNFELIEHLFWPKDFLLACHKALTPGGLFILTTPNMKGFDLLVLEKLSENVMGPEHLNYFNPQSLTYLMQNCGFEIIELFTPGKLDAEIVRKKILSQELDISDRSFLHYLLIEQWNTYGHTFQDFLAQNLLSSHLWVVARKP